MELDKQTVLDTWRRAIGGAIYNTMIKAAKELENSKESKYDYYDEE